MKKILCTILMLLMLPIACLSMAGCKDDGKNIKQFYTTYTKIADSTSNLTLAPADDTYQLNTSSYKIDINYTASSQLSDLVDVSSSKYYYLKHFYQQLLDDSLAPLYFFGDAISSSKKISDKQTSKLYNQLEDLKQDYIDIDYYLGILITSLKATEDETVNLSYLKKVFLQYEQAITSAGNLSATVCDIYFNTILSNSNMDYSSKTYTQLTDTDLGSITINVRARMYYYKAVYANIYNQLYIRNSNLADTLINTSATLPEYTPYDYIAGIKNVENETIETLRSNKQDIYNNLISLYNIQNNFDLAYKHFNNATSKVAYLDINEHSTIDEINHGKTISQFVNGIAYDSYEVISRLIGLLYI